MSKTIWLNKHITVDPEIRFGNPCIKGTRVTVADILNLLGANYKLEEIPKQYPGLAKEDVQAGIQFAAKLAEDPTRILNKATYSK